MSCIKRALGAILLALAMLIPTVAPAGANDGVSPGHYWCYEFDNQVHEHTEWDYQRNQGWRTITYHHYYECTDGTWYWAEFRYEWWHSYWVWTG